MTIEKQTAPERELGSGEETEQNLPLFPNLPADEAQEEHWDDFDWNNDPAVILQDQAATAVYFNRHHGLVIRQRDTLGSEGFVIIERGNIKLFLAGLRDRVRAFADE
jgi:hypothetical protein